MYQCVLRISSLSLQYVKTPYCWELINRKTSKQRRISIRWQMVDLTHMQVFLDAQKNKPLTQNGDYWPRERLNPLNNILNKLVVQYIKSDGNEIKPTSLKNYVLGYQRGFKYNWAYNIKIIPGPLLNDVKIGVMSVIDKNIRQMKAMGVLKQSPNLRTTEDIKLSMIRSCCRQTIPRAS